MRQLKREVKIGNVTIGGNNPIAVQTMLNVPVEDIEGNVAQAKRCEAAGCQILRVTCPSAADAKCIEAVKNAVNIPIVADIHFDYKAALACADVGVDKIRINPGNIGDDDRVKPAVLTPPAVEPAVEPEVAVEPDLLPPQADSRPAAPTTPAPFRKLRRVMLRDSKSMFIEIRSSEILFSFFPILNAKNGALRVPKTHKAPGTAPFVF